MGCDLYGASDLPGQPGLCRANPGTAYGEQKNSDNKKIPGAVMTQSGTIVPDPTRAKNDQPWEAYHGESLRSCDSRSGYYEIADSGPNGATFDHKSADVIRKFPNMSQDRVSLSAFGGKPGTLCVKADQPAIREGLIYKLWGKEDWWNPLAWFDGDCPEDLDDQQCHALAHSMSTLRPPQQNHLMEFFFLIAAFTIGPDIYHGLKNWWKNRGGGDKGGGPGGGNGNIEMTPEQLAQVMAAAAAAKGETAPQPEVQPNAQPASAQPFTADSFVDAELQNGSKSPVAKATPGAKGAKAPVATPPVPVVPAPPVVPKGAPVPVVKPSLVPAIP